MKFDKVLKVVFPRSQRYTLINNIKELYLKDKCLHMARDGSSLEIRVDMVE